MLPEHAICNDDFFSFVTEDVIIDINVANYLYDSLLLNSMEHPGEHCTVLAVL